MALNARLFLRTFIDEETATVTYLVGDRPSKSAVVIDPVKSGVEEYSRCLDAHDYTLLYVIDTHIHTDHITGSYDLALRHDARICLSEEAIEAEEAHEYLKDGQKFLLGLDHQFTVIATPGHTRDSICLLLNDEGVFTGDTLLLEGCGRAEDPKMMFDSITQRLFTLPPSCFVFPGHAYTGRVCRSMQHVKEKNPHINVYTVEEEFIEKLRSMPPSTIEGIDNNVAANLYSGK